MLSITGDFKDGLGLRNPLLYRGYVYDRETGLYYVSSRYYDPAIGRWINADDVDLLGANGDFTSLNLFVYCGNNPMVRKDDSGYLWNYVAGAVVNVTTTFIAAKVTGQEYTWKDAGIAALSGAANAIPFLGIFLSGAITGTYTGIMAYQNGASTGAAIGSGIFAGVCTSISIANLANKALPSLELSINAFTDLVFGTGYNSMAAATYKAVTTKPQKAVSNPIANPSISSDNSSLPRRTSRAVSILERELLLY